MSVVLACRSRGRTWIGPLAVAAVVLAGCTSVPSVPVAPAPSAPPASATPAPSASVVPDCGDPEQSLTPGAVPAAGAAPTGTFMRAIQRKGQLVAGVSADTQLFGARNPLTGQIEGFDIDVLREISTAIFGSPNKIEFRVISTADRIPALTNNQVDIVARTMTVNCARWAQIDFSSVYYKAGQKLMVPTDSKITSIATMARGQSVCAPKGSTSIDRIKKDYPDLDPVEVAVHTDCLVLFQQGKVDAITGDDAILAGFVSQDPYAKVVGSAFSSEPYGLGISRAHPDFVRFVNGVLDRMRLDGTWKRLYDKWLRTPLGVDANPPVAKYGRAA